ncbi:hypothetical protein [Marinobacterium aestuariivivens]|uniref:Secreted protein n=1 Tax=Marinobacterium aestuariivivens TaxID=1698799 RepID=A0ABW2A8U4_9GAMM
MKVPFKTTLLAAALTSLVAVPVWAAGDEETTMPATGTEQMQQDPAGFGTPAPVPQDESLRTEDPQQMGTDDPQTASTDAPCKS